VVTSLRSAKKLAALLAVSASVVCGAAAMAPADASAASYARACYTARGVAIRNLTTTIQYYSNGWRDFRAPGRPAATAASLTTSPGGCAATPCASTPSD
jgi:hypothetical protein